MHQTKILSIALLLIVAGCEKNLTLSKSEGQKNSNSPVNLPHGRGAAEGTRLVLARSLDLNSPKTTVAPDSVYSAYNLGDSLFTPMPAGYDDSIQSFRLPKGYMVVFAENNDGTGESVCYVAADSAITANLPTRLRNNISYVRYITVNNPDKKGVASTKDATVNAMGATWFYGWSLNRASFPGQQFVPMTWGKGTATDANVKYLVHRSDVDHLLSFNEPDNTAQSNIPNIDTAVTRYTIMQKSGLRLGSPVTTQDQSNGTGRWLPRFMAAAQAAKVRIDFIPLHWYDWGNQTNNKATDSLTAEGVFNRFVAYMQKVHAAYPAYPLWVTEFNANPNRTSVTVHEYFMQLATDWMNSTPYVERYAYFFPKPVPEVDSTGNLTNAGLYWKSLPTTKAFSGNIVSGDTFLIPD